MKLFTKDPLDAARDSLVKLTERLAIVESVVIEKKESTKRLAVDGADDAALDKAEAAVRAARDRVDTLTVAVREVETTISVLEAEQAAAADQKLRAQTVVELEAIERDLTKAADDFVSSAKHLSDIAKRMSSFMIDANGLAIFAASAGSEVPPNVVMLKTLLKGHASAVISGHGRATLPQPAPAPAALPAPPKPALVEVVTIKDVCWHDGNALRTVHPGYKLLLAPETAANSIKIDACVEPSDPRAEYHSSQRKVTTPLLTNCVPLDAESRAAVAAAEPRGVVEPIRRSAPPGIADASRPLQQVAAMRHLPPGFTPIDRGPPYVVTVPRSNPQPGPENDDE